jgi:quinol-cytochrome oxidoreductase complex cytochrome b subunit
MSYWGATVITNLFSAIPYIGPNIAFWLWGGFSVDSATLVRFFSLHYLLPFIIIVLVIVHLYFIHIQGSSNPLGISNHRADKITFLPYFYVKDLFALLVTLVFLMFIVFFYPNLFGHPDNYIMANAIVTPTHIVPEWYFLYFYAILRTVPNKIGGVICMVLAILVLVFIVWISKFSISTLQINNIQCKFYFNYLFFIFIFNTITLGWIGGQVIEYPYTLISIILTIFYFSFIFIWIIVINLIDLYVGQQYDN